MTSASSPPVPRLLAAALARRLKLDADIAAALVGELAHRFDLAVLCLDRATVAQHLTRGPDRLRHLSDGEYDRVRATPAWAALPAAIVDPDRLGELIVDVIAQAGLECVACRTALTESVELTLGHCVPCRGRIGERRIRADGCPAFGYRPHSAAHLTNAIVHRQIRCRYCGHQVTWPPAAAVKAGASAEQCEGAVWLVEFIHPPHGPVTLSGRDRGGLLSAAVGFDHPCEDLAGCDIARAIAEDCPHTAAWLLCSATDELPALSAVLAAHPDLMARGPDGWPVDLDEFNAAIKAQTWLCRSCRGHTYGHPGFTPGACAQCRGTNIHSIEETSS